MVKLGGSDTSHPSPACGRFRCVDAEAVGKLCDAGVYSKSFLVRRFFVEWDPEVSLVAAERRFSDWFCDIGVAAASNRGTAAAVAPQALAVLNFASDGSCSSRRMQASGYLPGKSVPVHDASKASASIAGQNISLPSCSPVLWLQAQRPEILATLIFFCVSASRWVPQPRTCSRLRVVPVRCVCGMCMLT